MMEQVVKQEEATLNKVFQQLLPILRRLFEARRTCKVTIHVAAGLRFKIEVTEFFDDTNWIRCYRNQSAITPHKGVMALFLLERYGMIGTATSAITNTANGNCVGWLCWHCRHINAMWLNQCSTCYIYKTSSTPRPVNHMEDNYYLNLPPTQTFPVTLKVESVEHGQPICILED